MAKTTAGKTAGKRTPSKKAASKKAAVKRAQSRQSKPARAAALEGDRIPGTHAKWVVENGVEVEYVWDQNGEPIRRDLYRP